MAGPPPRPASDLFRYWGLGYMQQCISVTWIWCYGVTVVWCYILHAKRYSVTWLQDYRLQATGLQVTSYRLQATGYRLQVQYYYTMTGPVKIHFHFSLEKTIRHANVYVRNHSCRMHDMVLHFSWVLWFHFFSWPHAVGHKIQSSIKAGGS